MKTSSLPRFVLSMFVAAALLLAACGKGGETTDPTGGPTAASSTSGGGGSSSTTTVTTGDTTTTTVTTGGEPCQATVSSCYCASLDPPAGTTCPTGITTCAQFLQPDYRWMNKSSNTPGLVSINVCSEGVHLVFDMTAIDSEDHPVPDWHGLLYCGDKVFFRAGDPDHIFCTGHFDEACGLAIQCFDPHQQTPYYVVNLSPQ